LLPKGAKLGDTFSLEIKSFESHDKLLNLTINYSNILKKNNDFLSELVNLTYLDLSENGLTEIPQLENLKKLEYINLASNEIHDKLPEYLNQLENLKYFYIGGNENINGKVLSNKSLEECGYSKDYDLCIPKNYELNCLKDKNVSESFETCEEEEINVEESIDGRCGEGHGRCPSGQCCSKYGWCGKTDDYCSNGCQSNYGYCETITSTTTTTTYVSSVEGRCGEDYGKCPSGQCCSKYGWCGKTDNYCSNGCQSEFGDCKGTTIPTITTTTNSISTVEGRCGEDYGKCPSSYCCSRYGWCGTTDDHCSVSKGCKSEFGKCN